MKRYGNLYNRLVSYENLWSAAKNAAKGRRFCHNTSKFNLELEKNLFELQEQLRNKTYKPGSYHTFNVYECKKRMISAAPYRDRVAHHALCNIIEPLFEKKFIFDTYANRKDKGTHRALDKYQRFAKNYKFVLKCDIKKYFPSIDHDILYSEINRIIKDKDVLWLVRIIIDNSNPQEEVAEYFHGDDLFTPLERRKGLPIGNLTSQLWAKVFLSRFYHFIKEELRCKAYIRYVDDFVLFAGTKKELWNYYKKIESYLEKHRLKIHPAKCEIFHSRMGVKFLGNRVYGTHRIPYKQNVMRFKRRFEKRIRHCLQGLITNEKLKLSLAGWLGHIVHSDTYMLRKKLYSFFKEKHRGMDAILPCSSWRLVEKQRQQHTFGQPQQEQPGQREQQQRVSLYSP